jgi:hypothetical protein
MNGCVVHEQWTPTGQLLCKLKEVIEARHVSRATTPERSIASKEETTRLRFGGCFVNGIATRDQARRGVSHREPTKPHRYMQSGSV